MRIAHGALLNLAGHAAPLLAALVVVPPLLERLGPERFGFLALAWALVGYFSLFDLGLGRVLTKLVAERLGTERAAALPRLAGTALCLTALLGAVSGLLLFAGAEAICRRLLDLPEALQDEAVAAVRVLAISLPAVTLSAALRGLLEAVRRFDWVNGIRVPLGVLGFAAPLAVAQGTVHLAVLCAALAVLRLAALVAHWLACARVLPGVARVSRPDEAAAREMLSFGAWLSVSNVVGPLMVYADRFFIGSLLGIAAVGYYGAPHEALTRLWIIPAALTGALFPALAAADAAQARLLHRKGVLAIAATAFPLAVFGAMLSPWWLGLWLGDEFAARAAPAALWIGIGVAVNCLAYVPFTLLQARGRADLTGMLHLLELPLYFAALYALAGRYGLEGAAMAWAGRCAFDAAALFALSSRHLAAGRA